jgi:uncharacterized membrane protein
MRVTGVRESTPSTILGVWTAILFVHLLCVAIWIGGQVTLFVATPPIRAAGEAAAVVLGPIGRRFGAVAGPALLLILVTGLLQADHLGVRAAHPFTGGFSRTVSEKLVLWVLMAVLTGVHGVLGVRIAAGGPEVERWRGRARIVSVVNLLLGLAALYLGAKLGTGDY